MFCGRCCITQASAPPWTRSAELPDIIPRQQAAWRQVQHGSPQCPASGVTRQCRGLIRRAFMSLSRGDPQVGPPIITESRHSSGKEA
jgi:hypothetical protein